MHNMMPTIVAISFLSDVVPVKILTGYLPPFFESSETVFTCLLPCLLVDLSKVFLVSIYSLSFADQVARQSLSKQSGYLVEQCSICG